MAFVVNYLQDKAIGIVGSGITYAGGIAGNAVGGVGNMIATGGRSAGDSVEGFVGKGGAWVNGYGDRIMSATATQDGVKRTGTAVKSTADKPKAATNTSNAYTKKALPANSSKSKVATPNPSAAKPVTNSSYNPQFSSPASKPKTPAGAKAPANAASKALPPGKARVSPASMPKLNSSAGGKPTPPSGPKPPVKANAPTSAAKKINMNGVADKVGKPEPKGVTSKVNDAGKVSISKASRPTAVKK